ncbi:MAG TPA: hypothetical protein VKS79_17205, partial [Gemmataceae bacterium]|nr:hypothetical protein [Gemmataceae bacterium]
GFLWLRAILLPLFWCSAVELEEVFESGDATFRKPSALGNADQPLINDNTNLSKTIENVSFFLRG